MRTSSSLYIIMTDRQTNLPPLPCVRPSRCNRAASTSFKPRTATETPLCDQTHWRNAASCCLTAASVTNLLWEMSAMSPLEHCGIARLCFTCDDESGRFPMNFTTNTSFAVVGFRENGPTEHFPWKIMGVVCACAFTIALAWGHSQLMFIWILNCDAD